MSWTVRTLFWSLVVLSTLPAFKCSAAAGQDIADSTVDRTLPQAPQPPDIRGSAVTDSERTAAAILGTVLDANRDVLPGALVTVFGESSSAARRSLTSGGNGEFAFTGLPPDIYKITVSAPGMNNFIDSELSLHEGETRIVSVVMSVFAGTTSITVSENNQELAEQQVQIAVRQRIGGIVPNFYSSYDSNAPPMGPKQKMKLSLRSIFDPVSMLTIAGTAGVQQYRNTFPGYGGGMEGYGKRYGANLADNVTGVLLSRGVYPSIFHQDPRYFYKGTGSIYSRFLYATSAAVIARGDDGRWQPNYSHLLGNFSAAGISNLYYPASDRGASLVLFNGLAATGATAFSNVLREFVFKRISSHAHKPANNN
jgi:Carboxypeptidase regulatory-like domain